MFRLKKLISLMLCIMLAFSCLLFVGASSNAELNVESSNNLKEENRNYYYVILYGRMVNFFPTTTVTLKEEKDRAIDFIEFAGQYTEAEKTEMVSYLDGYYENYTKTKVVYPDDYAGAYIDHDNNLHIILTAETSRSNYHKMLDNDDDIIFEYAANPLSRLLNIQEALNPLMQTFSIEATVLNEITNKIEIQLFDSSKDKDIIKYLESVINRFTVESITFNGTTGIKYTATTNTTSNALAGSESTASTDNATLGFNAYRAADGKYGVITAAHFATSGTSIKNANGTTIGSASARQLSGSIDAAFVPFPNGITKSYKLLNSNLIAIDENITGYYQNSQIISGMATTKIGKTSGWNYGMVTSTNITLNVSGTTLTDQLRVSNTQLVGDSGGPVLDYPYGPAIPWKLLGIATIADSSNNGYCSKVQNIMSALSITVYSGSYPFE